MTVMNQQPSIARPAKSGSLYDVLELILDKGLVIDIYVRVSLVGIEVLTIDARIVVASVDTYLRFAEAVNRLDLTQTKDGKTLDEFVGGMQEGGAHGKTKGALSGAKDAVSGAIHGGRDDDDERQPERRRSSSTAPRRRRRPVPSEDEG